MTDAAVTQGTFADFRLVKSRNVAQIVIEVHLEQANQALAALGGLPLPAEERWVAIARLETKAKVVPIKPDNTKLSFEAVKRCKEPAFQTFLRGEGEAFFNVRDEATAANAVRMLCRVDSRSGLNTDPVAASLWRNLDARFIAWKLGETA